MCGADAIKFAADVMLGKLARWLRILGYDTFYNPTFSAIELLKIAQDENRVLLTRNKHLLSQANSVQHLWVESNHPKAQLKQVIAAFELDTSSYIFRLCTLCNVEVHLLPKDEVPNNIPEPIRTDTEIFYQCPRCLRVYWKGSHIKRFREFLDSLQHFNPEQHFYL